MTRFGLVLAAVLFSAAGFVPDTQAQIVLGRQLSRPVTITVASGETVGSVALGNFQTATDLIILETTSVPGTNVAFAILDEGNEVLFNWTGVPEDGMQFLGAAGGAGTQGEAFPTGVTLIPITSTTSRQWRARVTLGSAATASVSFKAWASQVK